MNLHDIKPPTHEPTPVWWRELLDRRLPVRLAPYQAAWAADVLNAPTFQVVEEWQDILDRLHRQYIALQRGGLDPRNSPMVAFFLTEREWRVLVHFVHPDRLQRQGFEIGEAMPRTYRGFRLIIYQEPRW